jgi:glycosyltransferase involved in cell wall biosynthesis
LPTRDRLEYLKLAVETIRRQDCPDWEIVISDNDSSDDVAGWVESLNDRRVLYARTTRVLPVTENWNAALALSSGDYVLMLGDDDALLQGYVTRMRALVERFDRPDLIYTGALLFTYPGVSPEHSAGFLEPNCYATFFAGATAPFVLSRERALTAVRQAMDFRLAFNFNMQLSLVSRHLVERVERRGEFFQSQFPDYYATCAAFVEAERIVADPRPQVVIGVTPKSYGFFHLNKREQEGRAFLEARPDVTLTPGTNINDGWLGAMEAIAETYGSTHGLRVNRHRYTWLQAVNVYGRRFRAEGSNEEVAQLEARLGVVSRRLYRCADLAARTLIRLLPTRLWTRIMKEATAQFPELRPARKEGLYADVLEVFERERPDQAA